VAIFNFRTYYILQKKENLEKQGVEKCCT